LADETGGTSAVAEAPASTSTGTESPSTSPAQSSVPAARPTSFAEALTRAADSQPANPGVPPPASAPPPAAAPEQPPQTETPPAETAQAVDTKKGPLPYERHEAILKNARRDTEAQVTQRFQQQYGPHVELGNRIQADPVGTVVGLIQGLASHPEHGQAVISALARTLGGRRGQAASDQEPQADLQSPDGTQVYSAERLAQIRAYDRQQILKEVDSRLEPLQSREQQRVAAEKQSAEVTAANERMAKVLEPYKQALPDFEKHKPALREKSREYLEQGFDAQTALGLAVTHILREVVMPSRAAQSQQQLLADAVRKSTGSTSVPGSAPAAPAGRPRDFHQGFSRIAV
jgi:hypothetical protein